MSRHANPTLIGAFVFGASVLSAIVVMLMAGGQWFEVRRQHMLYFDGAAQGLQVGSPVVFLGVQVGTVRRIQLGINQEDNTFVVPVTIELEPHVVQSKTGEQIDLQDPKTIRQLVDRGLRGRLKVQSLLTGQLYIDLDFYPDKKARFVSTDPNVSEIPTIPTAMEEITGKLEKFPVDRFLADLAAIGESVKGILSSEEMKSIPRNLDNTLRNIASLSARLEENGGPLLDEIRADLAEMRTSLRAVQQVMEKADSASVRFGNASDQVSDAAQKVGVAADRVGNLVEENTNPLQSMTKAGDELADTARVLRSLAQEDSPTVQRLNEALQEITRASRALRILSETIEQQPEALLRGKQTEERQ